MQCEACGRKIIGWVKDDWDRRKYHRTCYKKKQQALCFAELDAQFLAEYNRRQQVDEAGVRASGVKVQVAGVN